MGSAYASADLVLGRAGASTLAEISAFGLPSVLVPYPLATDDHQTGNARTFVDAGAALVVDDAMLKGSLVATVRSLLDDRRRLDAMAQAAQSLARPGAAAEIARMLVSLIER
jgi:UDP-N-acetylglucosamine--N-acetylmuramyl-(pentapeptide) pyrophosphoryl-undecaprenol N-acetylglucosamine transferase